MPYPDDMDTLTARNLGLCDELECPECGGTNTVIWPLRGRYMAARCEDCGYEGDNLNDVENFGYIN